MRDLRCGGNIHGELDSEQFLHGTPASVSALSLGLPTETGLPPKHFILFEWHRVHLMFQVSRMREQISRQQRTLAFSVVHSISAQVSGPQAYRQVPPWEERLLIRMESATLSRSPVPSYESARIGMVIEGIGICGLHGASVQRFERGTGLQYQHKLHMDGDGT